MTTLPASRVRIPPDAFNRVVYGRERIRVERRGGQSVILVPIQDLELLEAIEDILDGREAEKALKEMEEKGESSIPLEEVLAELGL